MSGSRPRPYAPPVRGQLPPARGQLPAPPFGSSPSLLAALPRASSGFGFLRPLPDRQGEPLLRVQASTSGRASPCSWLRSSPDGSIGAVGPTALFVSSWPWTIRLGLGRVVIDLLHLPGAGRGGEALHLDAAAFFLDALGSDAVRITERHGIVVLPKAGTARLVQSLLEYLRKDFGQESQDRLPRSQRS